LNQQQTLDYLSSSRKSLIRLGDGESTILTGGDLDFQKNCVDLWRRLRRIVSSYNDDSPYVIALPNKFLVESKASLKGMHKYRIWGKTRYVYDCLLSREGATYLDALSFRNESELTSGQIESLWIDEKRIFFIHNDYNHYANFRAAHSGAEVVFIEIKSANSYEDIESILELVSEQLQTRSWSSPECCALVSAGPTGKVLVFELSRLGCRALDMGHHFDHKAGLVTSK
jgi:hypothetical protein